MSEVLIFNPLAELAIAQMWLFRKRIKHRAESFPVLQENSGSSSIQADLSSDGSPMNVMTFTEAAEHLDWLEANGKATKNIVRLENGLVCLR